MGRNGRRGSEIGRRGVTGMRSLVIFGCGGHAREVLHLCSQLDVEVLGFLDERPEWLGRRIDDVPVLGNLEDIAGLKTRAEVVCAGVGDPALKHKFHDRTLALGFRLAAPLIHPRVTIGPRVEIEDGTVICEGSILTTGIRVGRCVILNRLSNISHDCIVGDFATVSPGVNVSGNVIIGTGAYLGTGASIREKVRIGDWSIVGGGAFVSSDVPVETLVAGVPARFKKRVQKGVIWLSGGGDAR